MSALTAGLFAAGHGPGRNSWWVNLILVVLVIGGLIAWRIRAARKKRSMKQDDYGRASER